MNKNNPKYIIVHNTGGLVDNPNYDSSDLTFEQVNKYHKWKYNYISNLGFYIGYHYFIEKDGTVHQGRADMEMGAHCKGINDMSIGIGLAGNFDITTPTCKQIASLKELLSELMQRHNIARSKIFPHRHFANTRCYGINLSDVWAMNLVPEIDHDKDEQIKELKTKITLMERLIQLYMKLYILIKGRQDNKDDTI